MGLRDEISTFSLKNTGCSVGRLLDSLDKATASELQELLDDLTIPGEQLGRLSNAKGWGVHADSFQKHRRSACRCAKK